MTEVEKLIERMGEPALNRLGYLDPMHQAVVYLLKKERDQEVDVKAPADTMTNTLPGGTVYAYRDGFLSGRESMKREILQLFSQDESRLDYAWGLVKKVKP